MTEAITMPIPKPVSESAAIISMVERMARDPSVDVDKLRQILQLRMEIEARENERAFDSAMNAAQSEMSPVRKDAANPQTKSKYASFTALDHALRPIYTQHGFGLSFDTGDAPEPNMVRVLCFVTCAGHRRTYKIDMPADGKGAKGGDVMTRTHATGSAVTYGRRYLLLMIFNIAVGDEDDDGNAASPPVNGGDIVTPEQLDEIQKAVVHHGIEIKWLIEFINKKRNLNIHGLTEIPSGLHQQVLSAIRAKAAQKVEKAKP